MILHLKRVLAQVWTPKVEVCPLCIEFSWCRPSKLCHFFVYFFAFLNQKLYSEVGSGIHTSAEWRRCSHI